MSVASFKEIHVGRGGGYHSKGIRATRAFRAVTDYAGDDEFTVLAHANCPRIGNTHPGNSTAYCDSVEARNESFSKKVWLVTASYASLEAGGPNKVDPLSDDITVEWNTEGYQKVFEKDRDGNGIVNSAGDPFVDPPVEGDASRVVATIVANLAAVPSWILTYKDAVNQAGFTLDGVPIGAGDAKVQRVSVGKVQYRNGTAYRAVTLVMAFDDDTWTVKVQDRGFRERFELPFSPGTFVRIQITDNNEDPATSPVPLDGAGSQLTDPTPAAIAAAMQSFDIYKEKDFSVLPGVT